MENNILSFAEHARVRGDSIRRKVMEGIDLEEVHRYYNTIIDVSIRHLTLLQRYLVEEYLAEIISEFFFRGVEASKQYKAGRTTSEIEQSCVRDFGKVYALAHEFRLSRHLGEWDLYSVSIMAEDLAGKWFHNGLAYGKRQRKLRLL
jgi:hypothetical protein